MFAKLAKNPLLLVAAGAAIYFLFFNKSTSIVPAASSGGSGGGEGGGAASLINKGGELANELLKFGTGEAKEALGVRGMGPTSLNGVVASVGGFGDLGGSFYGSY